MKYLLSKKRILLFLFIVQSIFIQNLPAQDVVKIETNVSNNKKELAGEIIISIDSSDIQTYQALADAYMSINPKVKVLVELKKSKGDSAYLNFVRAQFATGKPRVSIIESPHFRDLAQEGLLVNWAPLLQQTNPYSGKKWENSFEKWALDLVRDPNTGEMFMMPYASVQTMWTYNKRIFKEAGIDNVPKKPSWEEFVSWNEKIKKAGYIPIAMEGTIDQIWSGGRMPWLLRSVSDQFRRDDLNIIRCQRGDWCYRDGVDDKWSYNPSDQRNDDPSKVSINIVRHLNALRNGDINFDNKCMEEMLQQVGRVFKTSHGFVPNGWSGMNDAYPLFLTQKAAMRMDHGGIFTRLERDIKSLSEGVYKKKKADSKDVIAAKQFEFGTFSFPSIESPCVQGKARANELTSGSLAIPKKSKKQNEIEIDFVMFWTSPKGIGIFLENKLDQKNLQGGIIGPPIIKGANLPKKIATQFQNTNFIGNYEKPGAPGDAVARGFFKYKPSVREWATMMQMYFNDELTEKQWTRKYQRYLDENFDKIIKYINITEEDLLTPEKKPPGWVAAGPY